MVGLDGVFLTISPSVNNIFIKDGPFRVAVIILTVRDAGIFSQDPGQGIVDEVSASIHKDPRGGLPQAQMK